MTKGQAIEILKQRECCRKCVVDSGDCNACDKAFDMAIKTLEQQPSDDVMAIHTQGLDEGIRCAMCTNSMRSDRGCDGGCVVNEDMYKKVMKTINNQMFSQPTSDDCVSRKAVLDLSDFVGEMPTIDNYGDTLEEVVSVEKIKALPPVTPTHGTCKDCKHNKKSHNAITLCYTTCDLGHRFELREPSTFYCADFERRE